MYLWTKVFTVRDCACWGLRREGVWVVVGIMRVHVHAVTVVPSF